MAPATIVELVNRMVDRGYKFTVRQFKYWYEKGLLPEGEKIGGFKEGVRLVFYDEEEILDRLEKVFELKGRGYKLNEIQESFEEEAHQKAANDRVKYIKRHILVNDEYYLILDSKLSLKTKPKVTYQRSGTYGGLPVPFNPQDHCIANDVADFWQQVKNLDAPEASSQLSDNSEFYYPKMGVSEKDREKDLSEIHGRRLVRPLYMVKGKKVFEIYTDLRITLCWLDLRNEFKISWQDLESLNNKHKANLSSNVFFPEIDQRKFTEEWAGWLFQFESRRFGWFLWRYISYPVDITNDILDPMTVNWDSKYESIDKLVKDFLSGHCAFVPHVLSGEKSIDMENYFLKRF